MSSTKYRTPPVTSRKLATRAKICEAAQNLFFVQGFDATTAEQIATAAGTRRSTFYTHFGDKDEILALLINDFLSSVLDIIGQLPSPEPTRQEIDTWIRDFAELVIAEQVPTVLLMQSSGALNVPDAIRDFGQAMLEALAERLPAFRESMSSSLGQARTHTMLRVLGSSLVHYLEDPRSGEDYLTVAGEWMDIFVRQYTPASAR